MFIQKLLVAAVVAVKATAALARNSTQSSVVDATYDGQCFYPKPTEDFELNSYLGRWYQVAGTVAPFTAGCKCIRADYSLNVSFYISSL